MPEVAESKQKYIDKMTGYKAVNKDLTTKHGSFQFEIGKWYEHEGDIKECEAGFHFCEQPSGVYAYYCGNDVRLFKIEAELILETPFIAGADYKRVCKRIRLVDELFPDGDGNTGDWNAGNRNTGDGNTGDENTGDWNAGNRNTGDGNTGYGNTGYRNTGYRNTGDWNAGNRNTGDWNAGNRNTGDWNAGYGNAGDWNAGNRNTGDWNAGYGNAGNGNTGNWNATNYSSGYFCLKEPTVICFDVDTKLTRDEFNLKYDLSGLYDAIKNGLTVKGSKWESLPGITQAKVNKLRKAFNEVA